MHFKARYILGIAVAALTSACSVTGPSLPENPVVGELPPMELPSYQVGQQMDFVNQLTGDAGYWKATNIASDGTVSATMGSGCNWQTAGAWFDGVGEWDNCGTGNWSAGTSTVVETGPSLWPLTDGASASYKFKNTNKVGESNTVSRSCEVSTANIETSIGPLDSYKVVCSDKSNGQINVRTWYFNPEHGELRFTRWKSDGGMRVDQKYL